MPPAVTTHVITGIVAAVFGGVLVAFVNNWFLRGVNKAMEKKLTAEAEKATAEALRARAEAEKATHRVRAQQDDIDEMSFIISRLLSTFKYFFLSEIGKGSDYQFRDSFRDKDHLRRLYDLQLIDKTDKLQNIADLKRGDLLKDKLRILPAGETYLNLREKVARRDAVSADGGRT